MEFAWAYWEFGESLDVRGCMSRQPERYRNEMILYSLENSENKFSHMHVLSKVGTGIAENTSSKKSRKPSFLRGLEGDRQRAAQIAAF